MQRRSFVQGHVSSIMVAVLFPCQGQWGLCIPDSWFSPIIRCSTAVWVKWAPEVSVLFLVEKKIKILVSKLWGSFISSAGSKGPKSAHSGIINLFHPFFTCGLCVYPPSWIMQITWALNQETPLKILSTAQVEGMLHCANSFCQGWMSFLKEVTWCRNYRVKWHGPCFIIDWTSWSWQSFLL